MVWFIPSTRVNWYSYNDNAQGTVQSTDAYDFTKEWTVPFGVYDELFYATDGLAHWLWVDKQQNFFTLPNLVNTLTSATVKRSSISPVTSYNPSWHNRLFIGLRTFNAATVNTASGDRIMYTHNNLGNHWSTASIALDGGMAVWVRDSQAQECAACPTGKVRLLVLCWNRYADARPTPR